MRRILTAVPPGIRQRCLQQLQAADALPANANECMTCLRRLRPVATASSRFSCSTSADDMVGCLTHLLLGSLRLPQRDQQWLHVKKVDDALRQSTPASGTADLSRRPLMYLPRHQPPAVQSQPQQRMHRRSRRLISMLRCSPKCSLSKQSRLLMPTSMVTQCPQPTVLLMRQSRLRSRCAATALRNCCT